MEAISCGTEPVDSTSTSSLCLSEEAIRFDPASAVSRVFFDNANEQLFSIRSGGVTGVVVKGPNEDRSCSFTMDDKGEILSVKLCPDQSVMAIQRSRKSVEFMNSPQFPEWNRGEYSQACKAKSASIIGFAWTGFGTDIIFVTDQSVEFYEVQPARKCLRYIKLYSMQVNWFIYQPITNYLLVSSGILGNVLHPIYFSGQGMCTRHSKFEVDLPVVPKPPKLCLLDRDVSLCRIYGKSRVVVLRHKGNTSSSRSGAAEIVVYTIDGATPPRKTNILKLEVSGRFAINLIDNLIIVHHQSSKTSQIFDIGLEGHQETNIVYHSPIVAPEVIGCKGDFELYSANWVVFQPNIIIDAKIGLLWRLTLNPERLSHLIRPAERLIDFLLLRKNCQKIILQSMKRIVAEETPLKTIATIMGKIAHIERISEKLVSEVFEPLSDEVDKSYLFGVFVEHIRTKDTICDNLRDAMVANLVDQNKFYQLHQFLQYHILGDSKPIACQLLDLAPRYTPAQQLALDMLYRLGSTHEETIETLLNNGKVISALKVVQAQGNQDTVSARKFLEAAKQTNDPSIFYSVYRFFVQRNITLRNSALFPKGEMCQQYVAHYKTLFGDCLEMLAAERNEV
ncbi:regulator of MON1-CCZ1 complex [Galendromus occidentalis]|uniref:Regulator of MON1-CCZ1 complex n=1 Tax=Galendromus occidentalis TaxID=34638 RepID=A0AAJ6QYE8_9ACAR|nr:regulator of MON1-CCZ1 complex [Galendromus occidentalis]